MKKRNLLALILALLMLLTLFGACVKTPADGADKDSTTDKPKDKPKGNEIKPPPEGGYEVKTLTMLRPDNPGRSTLSWADAIKNGDACAVWFEDYALEAYGLIFDPTIVNSDAYNTTFTGYVASNSLPDTFQMIDEAATRYSMVEQGILANLDDVFAYSNGIAYGIYYGGVMEFNRAACTLSDGNWYWWNYGNNLNYKLNLSDSVPGGYLAEFGVFVIYPLQIRYDWLDALGLAMPQTPDEFFDALLTFNKEDVNGNGINDERLVMALGKGGQYEAAPADWFGLNLRYQLNLNTGEVQLPELQPGYIPFLEYCKKLYDNQLVLLEEGGMWEMTPHVEGGYVSAYAQYPSQFGPADGPEIIRYMPLPLMKALDDVKPNFQTQLTIGTVSAWAVNVSADYEACGRFLDYTNCEEYVMTYMQGIKGKQWDVVDGYYVSLTLTEEEKEKGYGGAQRFSHAGGLPQVTLLDLYHPNAYIDYSIAEALANERPEGDWVSICPPSHAAWVEKQQTKNNRPWVTMDTPNAWTVVWKNLEEFGAENINFRAYDGPLFAYLTLEEAEIMSKYGADLNTHLNEMSSGFILGNYTADNYDSLMDKAKSLGLIEVLNVYQARMNRSLLAMGRDPIELRK